MTKTLDEVKIIMEKFMKLAYGQPQTNGCGISNLGMIEKSRQGKFYPGPSQTIGKPIAATDDRDEFCIVVSLEEAFPDGVALPEEYEGVRIYVDVVGPITFLGTNPTRPEEIRDAFQKEYGIPTAELVQLKYIEEISHNTYACIQGQAFKASDDYSQLCIFVRHYEKTAWVASLPEEYKGMRVYVALIS